MIGVTRPRSTSQTVRNLLVCAALLFVSISSDARASEESRADLAIKSVMCAASGYCNAYFQRDAIPMHTCTRDTRDAVRWDATTPAGAHMLSVLQSAQLSGKLVLVSVDGCLLEYPKLNYVQIQ
jgi:hypothetical protein